MEGILKVTPEKLMQSSGEFAIVGNQVRNLTGEMMALVQSMKGLWLGEASLAYAGRFQGLQTDMDKLYRMIQEHASDLQEMAGQYFKAESGNTEQGNALDSNVVF